jgi:hypothetical protein
MDRRFRPTRNSGQDHGLLTVYDRQVGRLFD